MTSLNLILEDGTTHRPGTPAEAGLRRIDKVVTTQAGTNLLSDPPVLSENWTSAVLSVNGYLGFYGSVASGLQLSDFTFDPVTDQFTLKAGTQLPVSLLDSLNKTIYSAFQGAPISCTVAPDQGSLELSAPLPDYIKFLDRAGDLHPMGVGESFTEAWTYSLQLAAGPSVNSSINLVPGPGLVLYASPTQFTVDWDKMVVLQVPLVFANNGFFPDLTAPTQAQIDTISITQYTAQNNGYNSAVFIQPS